MRVRWRRWQRCSSLDSVNYQFAFGGWGRVLTVRTTSSSLSCPRTSPKGRGPPHLRCCDHTTGQQPEGFETRGAWRKFPSDHGTRANATQVRLDTPPHLCAPSSMPSLEKCRSVCSRNVGNTLRQTWLRDFPPCWWGHVLLSSLKYREFLKFYHSAVFSGQFVCAGRQLACEFREFRFGGVWQASFMLVVGR